MGVAASVHAWWSRKVRGVLDAALAADAGSEQETPDPWAEHVSQLNAKGIPTPGAWQTADRVRPTVKQEQSTYFTAASFVDRLPWVEYLPEAQGMLLEDGLSIAAFYELFPVGTEGRGPLWLAQVRDALENALQDSFEELDQNPWVVQFYAQDDSSWDGYLQTLHGYIQPRARGTQFTEEYLRHFEQHLVAIGKPGGLFRDTTLTQLPWRGQTRRVRLVIYRRVAESSGRRARSVDQDLAAACDRLTRALSSAGVKAQRLSAADIHDWFLRWFNPSPDLLGTSAEDRDRFYRAVAYPKALNPDDIELASGTDFSQRLFFSPPRSDLKAGLWYFDRCPHRVVVLDRLRSPPAIGHVTGEMRHGSDSINALFDQLPEGTVMAITMVITPQDALEAHLNYLAKKSVGETVASENARRDVQQARSIIGSSHKLYRASVSFYLSGSDVHDLESRSRQVANVMLTAGLQPVRDEDEVAPLNTYLRWLPCVYDPAKDRQHWYSQLMFAQHISHLLPVWGRSRGTGHPGITFFGRGGGTITFDPLSRLDRQMNGHLFLFGPTGSGKSATLNNMLIQITAIYRPRIFVVEAGNSFGLLGAYAERLGLTVHRLKLAPGSGVSLAPFADARRLVDTPRQVHTLDVDAIEDNVTSAQEAQEGEQRDVLGELEITARLMITGGEAKEEARMTRADRSLVRQCVIDAAHTCGTQRRTVITEDVRNALRARSTDALLSDARRSRLLEMADAMEIFCQGMNGQLFNRPGTPWPEADITIVDLATFAREGYEAELSIAYISLINTVNNIAERDQFLGRPIVQVTDEGHIITRRPLLAPYTVKITKMWRKLGAWFWLATPTLDDLPPDAQALLNMIEWLVCLSMPPDDVERIARFRELTPEQKALILSARKESGKFSEGVVLSRTMEVLFRAVLPSLHLALAGTEGEEKNERYQIMVREQVSELDAAIRIADQMDQARSLKHGAEHALP